MREKQRQIREKKLKVNRRSGRDSGWILFVSGTVLIAAAALMFGMVFFQKLSTEEYCGRILIQLQELIPERTLGAALEFESGKQPVLEVDGVSCAGILEVECLGKQWPVAGSGEESEQIPKLLECGDGQIMIEDAGKGRQFERITAADTGSRVSFTDLYGQVYLWEITEVMNGMPEHSGDSMVLVTWDEITGKRKEIVCVRSNWYGGQ